MGSFFNMDSPFFRAMSRVADLLILNVVFVICCIPIVTIGPALTGLFYVTLKMVRNEESYIVRGFFHSFKQNLRQGIIINLIMMAAGVLLWMDLRIVRANFGGNTGFALSVVFAAMAFFYLMLFIYIYPVLSRFYNTIRNTFINSFLMAIRHLPYTVLMIFFTACPILIIFMPESMTAVQSILLLLLILMGFSTIAYCNSFFMAKILDKYMPTEEDEEKVPEEAEDTISAQAGAMQVTPLFPFAEENQDTTANGEAASNPEDPGEAVTDEQAASNTDLQE